MKKPGRNDLCPCASRDSSNCTSNTATIFSEAQHLFQQQEYKSAIQLYNKILNINPNHSDALHYWGLACYEQGDTESGLHKIKQSLEMKPDDSVYQSNFGHIMLSQGRLDEAEFFFYKAVELDRNNVDANYNLAVILERTGRPRGALVILEPLADVHSKDYEIQLLYAKVLGLVDEWAASVRQYETVLGMRPNDLKTKLDYCSALDAAGQKEQAGRIYDELLNIDSKNVDVLLHRASLCEKNNQLEEAEQWLNKARDLQTKELSRINMVAATLYRRRKMFDQALACLHEVDRNELQEEEYIACLFERSKILDAAGRFAEAFEAFASGNEAKRLFMNLQYDLEREIDKSNKEQSVFNQGNLRRWSEGMPTQSDSEPKPIFIVGFPRSGTTLLEQILSSHENISAGGEMRFIEEIKRNSQSILGASSGYPDCLLELNAEANRKKLRELRKIYLQRVSSLGVVTSGAKWFTDKLPFNAYNLGLIHLVFHDSPVIHMIRHPLDSCLSSFFSNFNSQHKYATQIYSIACKYKHMMEQVNYYKDNIAMKYLEVKYENLVSDTRSVVEKVLNFIGEPWDEQCLRFYENKRIARTSSYDQVNRKMYSTSLNRYLNYKEQLRDIIQILQPTIEDLGYSIEQMGSDQDNPLK